MSSRISTIWVGEITRPSSFLAISAATGIQIAAASMLNLPAFEIPQLRAPENLILNAGGDAH
jgi:hypothetical protein